MSKAQRKESNSDPVTKDGSSDSIMIEQGGFTNRTRWIATKKLVQKQLKQKTVQA
jgi:hypothetical protein